MTTAVPPMPPEAAVAPEAMPPAVTRWRSREGRAQLGVQLAGLFQQYEQERKPAEQRWMKNLRQYLGEYDPEIASTLSLTRSKAYPRLTRVKVNSTLSRLMHLLFPGNERNWQLTASPAPELPPEEVQAALAGMPPAEEGQDPAALLDQVVQRLATERAALLSTQIDDQLQELGGDQMLDYPALCRKVLLSGILYGMGVLRGPFVRETTQARWAMGPNGPERTTMTRRRPHFEFISVWDFYADMSAKSLREMDGYFLRLVMSRAQVQALTQRPDVDAEDVKAALQAIPNGNYVAKDFEQLLRQLGVATSVQDATSARRGKYEVIVWSGAVDVRALRAAGVTVPETVSDDDTADAEVWMLGNTVLRVALNPWHALGVPVRMAHTFLFEEDDTSPVGNGLPQIMRDSQMAVAAATRMLLDNAGVVCGPNLELNTDLLRADQDLTTLAAHKIWYREGTGAEAGTPAVRNISIDAHLAELLQVIDLFVKFADMETFVGPATGGDMARAPSEPMRTAAGASMLRGDAALPFKDIVRNFDGFTQSVVTALVQFNRTLNPSRATLGDVNVVARGATSLMAKEVRGIQVDTLAASLSPEERLHVDERKFVEARFAVRDLHDLLLPPDEVQRKKAALSQQQEEEMSLQRSMVQAQIRDVLAGAYKSITQGQKNATSADANAVKSALDILTAAMGGMEGAEGMMTAPPEPPAMEAPAAGPGPGLRGMLAAGTGDAPYLMSPMGGMAG